MIPVIIAWLAVLLWGIPWQWAAIFTVIFVLALLGGASRGSTIGRY